MLRFSEGGLSVNDRSRTKEDGRLRFYRYLSLHTMGGGGFTPSPSHNTSTGPMSFPGGYPQSQMGVPQSQTGREVPHDGVLSLPRSGGVPPWPGQDGLLLARLEWGTPQPGMRCSPQPGQDGVTAPPPRPGIGYIRG